MSNAREQSMWSPVKALMGQPQIILGPEATHQLRRAPDQFLSMASLYKFASKLIGSPKRVLDGSCGEGLGTWLLAKECGAAVGVDQNEGAVAVADSTWKSDKISFKKAGLEELEEGAYDAVVLLDSARSQSLTGPSVMRRAARLLRHDGIAIVAYPCRAGAGREEGAADQQAVPATLADEIDRDVRACFSCSFIFSAHDETISAGCSSAADTFIVVGCKKKAAADESGARSASREGMALTSVSNYYTRAFYATSKRKVDLTFFVACYNEQENIVSTLDTLADALGEFTFCWEIIIIDDGSVDRSLEVIRGYMKEHPELPIWLRSRAVNQGLAQNYIDGAFLGKGTYYKLVCGDDCEPRETIVSVLSCMGKAEMVLPYFPVVIGRGWFRRTVSTTYTLLVNLISGYRLRYYNGVGIHRRLNVVRWHSNYHGFSFQADLITRLLDRGATVMEVEAVSQERKAGKSKAITLKNFLSVSHFLLDLFIRRVGRRGRRNRSPSGTGGAS